MCGFQVVLTAQGSGGGERLECRQALARGLTRDLETKGGHKGSCSFDSRSPLKLVKQCGGKEVKLEGRE